MSIEIRIASDFFKLQKQRIEGPTATQARKMAATRLDWMARAEAIRDSNPDVAFELDCGVFDLENDLISYGFTLDGKKARKS